MLWQDGEQISTALETVFTRILQQRMQGLPVLNPALSVQVAGVYQFNEDWLGILITPWFMNLLLLPGADSPWCESKPGAKFDKALPYGIFEFTLAREEMLGIYAQCSLFSPMFEFTNQADALLAAQAALQEVLNNQKPRGLSRRDLLRGAIGNGSA